MRTCMMVVLIFAFVASLGSVMVIQDRASQSEKDYLMTATAIQATNQYVISYLTQTAVAKLFTVTPSPAPTK